MRKAPRIEMNYFFMSAEDLKANKNPRLVIIDDISFDQYTRASGHNREMDWFVKDMSAELKAWGHLGGGKIALIMRSDGERSIMTLGESLAKFYSGRITSEAPAKGESQSNGAVEQAGKTIREHTMVMKEQVEDKVKKGLHPEGPVVQWMIRWSTEGDEKDQTRSGKDRQSSSSKRRIGRGTRQ